MTDLAGNVFNMEYFTDTTDGSGQITVTLSNTPTHDNAVMVFCKTAKRLISNVSRTGAALTITIRKMTYDKTDDPITGALSNLPAGVTEQSTKQNTDSANGYSSDHCTAGAQSPRLPVSHAHGVSHIYEHDHTPGYTATDLPLATSESITVVIGYAF